MQGRVVTAWHQAGRAIPDSLGHDGESLCQGTPQKWASAYFVARLSFTGNSCAPMLEGVGSLLRVSPNHRENKESHCQESCFPPNTVEEHIKFTVPYRGTAINILQEQSRRQEQASLGLFVFLSRSENWPVTKAT